MREWDCKMDDWFAGDERCDGPCCHDPWCFGKTWGDMFRPRPFCLCWDPVRRCWFNPRTGLCVGITALEL